LMFFHSSRHHRDLHSFPTRRSSDLSKCAQTCPPCCTPTSGRDLGQRSPTRAARIPNAQNRSRRDHYSAQTAARNKPPLGQAEARSEEHTSELQSRGHLVCRLLLEKK